jgi:anthranilate synthase component 1
MRELSLEEVRNLVAGKEQCVVPLIRRLPMEELKPIDVYAALRRSASHAFLLESAIFGEKIARYSFLGAEPAMVISLKNRVLHVNGREERIEENPLKALRRFVSYEVVSKAKLPKFFGGLIGFFAYDVVRYFEDIGSSTKDDLRHEDALFLFARDVIAFDHWREEVLLISNLILESEDALEAEYARAVEALDQLEDVVRRAERVIFTPGERKNLDVKSNFTKEAFEEAVAKAKGYIYEGEIFQVVLSQRFEVPFNGDAFSVYLALKEINPSPYMYCLELGDKAIVGSSPEILVRVENGKVVVRPIAGTRPRGKDVVEDEALAREMVNDEKERAEHVMLVDLGRNDVGKVSRFGSVVVDEFMTIEKYSHVQHIVSNVVGELREDKDAFDALEACFPAGTVSGAPKVRAMQIIEELEPTRRGVYAGAVGYFSFSGEMDFAIAIRTIVIQNGKAYVQAGAGIVADSVPEREYEETRNKGKAMLRAIALAGG